MVKKACNLDAQVLLISPSDGVLLSFYSNNNCGFIYNWAMGIHWNQNDEGLLIYSYDNLVILKLDGEKGESLQIVDEIVSGRIGCSGLHSACVYWRNNQLEKSLVVVGGSKEKYSESFWNKGRSSKTERKHDMI